MHGTVKSGAIRVLNDNFRSTFIGGQMFMTAGVSEMPLDVKASVLLMVKTFNAFDKDNDLLQHGARLRQLRSCRRNVLLEDRLLRLRLPLWVGRSSQSRHHNPRANDHARRGVLGHAPKRQTRLHARGV